MTTPFRPATFHIPGERYYISKSSYHNTLFCCCLTRSIVVQYLLVGQVDLAETDENKNENERGNENEKGNGRQEVTDVV